MPIEGALIRKAGPFIPHGLEPARRFLRLPWLLGNYPDEVLADDNPDESRKSLDRPFVHRIQCGADARRPHHAAVQHAWHAHVLHVLESPRCDGRNVEPRYRLSKDFPVSGRLPSGIAVEWKAEPAPSNQITVRDAPRGVSSSDDHTVRGRELLGWHAEPRRGQLDEGLTSGRRGQCEIALIEVGGMRLRTRRGALIRRDRGVALHQRHSSDWDAELLGHELRLCCEQPVAELAFAGVGGDVAVRADRDPRVELRTARTVQTLG